MKLALLGYPIAHSLSPKLYREFLGNKLESYDLLEIENSSDIPSLEELKLRFNGLSITSPHKKHFFSKVKITSPIVQKLQAINTVAFRENGFYGTNTDAVAVEKILARFKGEYPDVVIIVLGDGVMAKLTAMVADSLSIPMKQFSRSKGDDIAQLDLSSKTGHQTIVINSCSRNFVFRGRLNPDHIFWDYNYAFNPHQTTLPSQVKSYQDGEEMLRLQALAALEFWSV